MAEKCFGQILKPFLGTNTIDVGKVENQAQMTQFWTRNIRTLLGVHLLSFPVSTTENYFGQIFTTFQARTPPE